MASINITPSTKAERLINFYVSAAKNKGEKLTRAAAVERILDKQAEELQNTLQQLENIERKAESLLGL